MHELVDMANKIADEICKAVKEHDPSKFGEYVGMGADGTETQYIDKFAEDIALKIIGNKANVLSEEAGFIDNGREYTIVIDPIDGTRNAIHGIPFFGVSVAIGKRMLDDIEYGVVKNIPTGDTYTARKGKGAYLNGKRIKVEKETEEPIYCLVLGKSGNERTWRIASSHTIRAMGAAAVEMCLVASGSVQAYFMGRETLRVTDIAASTLIVREAGGEVYDIHGKVLDAPLTLDVRTSVVAVASRKIMEVLV
ncbi:MAG: inositol monophosphatase [Thermoplasmata archaeon]|nr:inositol monophosphatase [Thermoplasmata archaeon]